MNDTMQHRHAIMSPKPGKIAEIRDLLIQCEKQITLKKAEGGPISWCASFDETTNQFFVDSIFSNEEALTVHQNNIGFILKNFATLLVAPPETTIRSVFTTIQ